MSEINTVDTFVINLPSNWIELPTDPRELGAKLRESLAAAMPDALDDVDVRRLLVLMERSVAQAVNAGVVMTAAMQEVVGPETLSSDTSPDDESATTLLTAVAWLVGTPAAELGVESISFEDLRTGVEGPPDSDRAARRLGEPTVVDLPAGPAIRETTFHRLPASDDLPDDPQVLERRYHLVIGPGEGFAVLGFLTPNIDLADELLELFEAIATTLELVAA